MNNYTVELRNGRITKIVHVTCTYNQLLGTIAEQYPGFDIVRYY